jgi:hypothetical protein
MAKQTIIVPASTTDTIVTVDTNVTIQPVSPTTTTTSTTSTSTTTKSPSPTTTTTSTSTTTSTTSTSTSTTTTQPTSTGVTPQGYGKDAVGGSTIVNVANKAQFDDALRNPNGKIIKFTADVTFNDRIDLINVSYLTIDGNGHNVTIDNNNNGDGISFDGANTHHCILKGIRVINAGNDGISFLDGAHDILVTNCSTYNNRDGSIDIVTGSNNITVQWCIIGDATSGASLIDYPGTKNISVHHNIYASFERNPLIGSQQKSGRTDMVCDFVNNIVWKWQNYGTDVNNNGTANVRNNYYYSQSNPGRAVLTATNSYGTYPQGFAYVTGNVSGNGGNPNSASNHAEWPIPAQFKIPEEAACAAARRVLQLVGLPAKTSYEQNIINSITLTNC